MSRLRAPLLLVLLASPLALNAQGTFRRGDANLDGVVTAADVSRLVDTFIGEAGPPRCADAADANDNGSVDASDPIAVQGWLLRDVSVLPGPFMTPGPDPTPDAIGCADDDIDPPDPPTPDDAFGWDGPEVVRPGQAGVTIFLRATTSSAVDGLSLAYRVSRHATFRKADFAGTAVPAAMQSVLQSSPFFNVRTLAGASPDYRLLLVTLLFVDPVQKKRLAFAATQGPLQDTRLLRIEIDIATTAPKDTEVELFVPAIDLDSPLPGVGGVMNGFIGSGRTRMPDHFPAFKNVINSSGEIFFLRGDANCSGGVDIGDPVKILYYSFLGGVNSCCDDAMDSNDDGAIGLHDAIFDLVYLYVGGAEPAAPGPHRCGGDMVRDELSPLNCRNFPSCPP